MTGNRFSQIRLSRRRQGQLLAAIGIALCWQSAQRAIAAVPIGSPAVPEIPAEPEPNAAPAMPSAPAAPVNPPIAPFVPRLNDYSTWIVPAVPPLLPANTYLPPQNPIALTRLVLRLSERRVYVYNRDQLKTSFPVAIGRAGWETPVGDYQVIQMVREPTWEHPFTGELVPPGPDNPLGDRWIGFWTDGTNYIGFHGTPNEETVGSPASHGCVRMYNRDVLSLFDMVEVGTPVSVQP